MTNLEPAIPLSKLLSPPKVVNLTGLTKEQIDFFGRLRIALYQVFSWCESEFQLSKASFNYLERIKRHEENLLNQEYRQELSKTFTEYKDNTNPYDGLAARVKILQKSQLRFWHNERGISLPLCEGQNLLIFDNLNFKTGRWLKNLYKGDLKHQERCIDEIEQCTDQSLREVVFFQHRYARLGAQKNQPLSSRCENCEVWQRVAFLTFENLKELNPEIDLETRMAYQLNKLFFLNETIICSFFNSRLYDKFVNLSFSEENSENISTAFYNLEELIEKGIFSGFLVDNKNGRCWNQFFNLWDELNNTIHDFYCSLNSKRHLTNSRTLLGHSPTKLERESKTEELISLLELAERISGGVLNILPSFEGDVVSESPRLSLSPVIHEIVDLTNSSSQHVYSLYTTLLASLEEMVFIYLEFFLNQKPAKPLKFYLEHLEENDQKRFSRFLPLFKARIKDFENRNKVIKSEDPEKFWDLLAFECLRIQNEFCNELESPDIPLIQPDMCNPEPFFSLRQLLIQSSGEKKNLMSIEDFVKEIDKMGFQEGIKKTTGSPKNQPESLELSPLTVLWEKTFKFLEAQTDAIKRESFISPLRSYATQSVIKELSLENLQLLFFQEFKSIFLLLMEIKKQNITSFKTKVNREFKTENQLEELLLNLTGKIKVMNDEENTLKWVSLYQQGSLNEQTQRREQHETWMKLKSTGEQLIRGIQNLIVLQKTITGNTKEENFFQPPPLESKDFLQIIEDYTPDPNHSFANGPQNEKTCVTVLQMDYPKSESNLCEKLEKKILQFEHVLKLLFSLPPGSLKP